MDLITESDMLTNTANCPCPTASPTAVRAVAVGVRWAIAIAIRCGRHVHGQPAAAAASASTRRPYGARCRARSHAIVLPTRRRGPPLAQGLPTAGREVLALPPILVNTFIGIQEVDADLVEAARGQGLSGSQILTRVELPVAVPVIVTGVRSAAVQIVATATLGAIFGFGGLGRFLVDGLARFDTGMLFGGALLVAVMVVAATSRSPCFSARSPRRLAR